MDYTKELDLIEKAESRAKDLNGAAAKLKITLAALEEIEQGGEITLRIDCGKNAELNIDKALNRAAVTKHFKGILEEAARRQYVTLAQIYGEDTGAKLETPEKIKTELVREIPERIPTPVRVPRFRRVPTA